MARRVIVWSHSVDLRGEVKMGEFPWSVDDMLPVDSDRDDDGDDAGVLDVGDDAFCC